MRFLEALSAPGFGAIAEFKRRSPSAGDLRPGGDIVAVARAYERAGARAMSVLVDERFGGSLADLAAARAASSLPLLAKGFFSRERELGELAAAGADAVLVGESLVTEKDPRAAVADLVTAGSHPALRGERD